MLGVADPIDVHRMLRRVGDRIGVILDRAERLAQKAIGRREQRYGDRDVAEPADLMLGRHRALGPR